VVHSARESEDCQEGGVDCCKDEGEVCVGGCLGAEAEDSHPGEPGVEEGAVEDGEEEVDGNVMVPFFVAGWRTGG